MNPRLDAIVAAIRKHLPLHGCQGGSYWFLRCTPRGSGAHVRLKEYRAQGRTWLGPFATYSFYARDAEAVEAKLADRGLV